MPYYASMGGEMAGGYGHEPVVDDLVPRFIGLDRQKKRLVKTPDAPPPLIEIVGERLAGKTLLLDELYDSYRNRIPLAYVDLAQHRSAGRTTPRATSSDTAGLLYLLSYFLGRAVPRYRELRFPRLTLGLLVVTMWEPDSGKVAEPALAPGDLKAAEEEVRSVLAKQDDDRALRRQAFRDWLAAVQPLLLAWLKSTLGLDGIDALLRTLLATATDLLLAPRVNHGAVSWWGERLREELKFQGSDLQCLFDLARLFPAGGPVLSTGEVLLLRALLADISGYYGPVRRFNRLHPPLILLDNLHSPAGAQLRDQLAKAYTMEKGRIRPLIVATSLGRPTDEQRRAFERATDVVLGRLGGEGAPPEGYLTFGLPRARTSAIETMLVGRQVSSGSLPSRIAELSGGRTGWARTLAHGIRSTPRLDGHAPDDQRPGEGQAHPGGGSGRSRRHLPLLDAPVRETLLDQLYPDDPRLRADMALLAAALDDQAVHWLWAAHGGRDSGPSVTTRRLSRAIQELSSAYWQREQWPWPAGEPVGPPHSPGPIIPFAGDRALRTLLLAELAGSRSAEEWRQVHARLREHYLPRDLPRTGVGHTTAYLHHTLAMGDVDTVVRNLHARLRDTDPAAWLAAVNVICAAPHPPGGVTTAAEPPPCPADQWDDRHDAVRDLVVTLWRVSHPLAVADENDRSHVDDSLRDLYGRRESVFHEARTAWTTALAEGLRAPDLPVPGPGKRGAGR